MKFTRTVKTTTVELATINFKGGKPVMEDTKIFTMAGKFEQNDLEKIIKKEYPANTVIVSSEISVAKYEMSLETFLEHATLIADDSSEEEIPLEGQTKLDD